MAIRFNGVNQWIDLGVNLPVMVNVSAATIMSWYHPLLLPAPATQSPTLIAFAIGPGTGSRTGSSRLALEGVDGANTFKVTVRALDGDTASTPPSSTNMQTGVWYHLAAVIDFTTATGFYYLNGVLDSVVSFTNMTPGNTSNTNSRDASIGANEDGVDDFLNGSVEDQRLYERALGPNEISTIFAAHGNDGILDGLVARFMLNELGEGVTVTNVVSICGSGSIQGRSGAPQNGPIVYVPGILRYRNRNSPYQRKR